jgi:hypothetical protein
MAAYGYPPAPPPPHYGPPPAGVFPPPGPPSAGGGPLPFPPAPTPSFLPGSTTQAFMEAANGVHNPLEPGLHAAQKVCALTDPFLFSFVLAFHHELSFSYFINLGFVFFSTIQFLSFFLPNHPSIFLPFYGPVSLISFDHVNFLLSFSPSHFQRLIHSLC